MPTKKNVTKPTKKTPMDHVGDRMNDGGAIIITSRGGKSVSTSKQGRKPKGA